MAGQHATKSEAHPGQGVSKPLATRPPPSWLVTSNVDPTESITQSIPKNSLQCRSTFLILGTIPQCLPLLPACSPPLLHPSGTTLLDLLGFPPWSSQVPRPHGLGQMRSCHWPDELVLDVFPCILTQSHPIPKRQTPCCLSHSLVLTAHSSGHLFARCLVILIYVASCIAYTVPTAARLIPWVPPLPAATGFLSLFSSLFLSFHFFTLFWCQFEIFTRLIHLPLTGQAPLFFNYALFFRQFFIPVLPIRLDAGRKPAVILWRDFLSTPSHSR